MKKLFLIICLFFFAITEASAAWHIYVVPVVGKATRVDIRRPKYIPELNVPFSVRFFGYQPYALVAADVSDAQDTVLQAYTDVVKLPDNLDQQVGGALAVVQARLEARNIPAGWINATTTYRTILKAILGIFAFMQRFPAITRVRTAILSGSVTLDTQFQSLSATTRQHLLDTALSLKFDPSGLTGTSTLRQILKSLSDQWTARQGGIKVGGVTVAQLSPLEIFYWHYLQGRALAWAGSSADNFNRANANPISGNWSIPGSYGLQIINNRARAVSDQIGSAIYTGYVPAAAQDAQVSVPTLTTGKAWIGLRVDPALGVDGSGFASGYYFGCSANQTSLILIYDPDFSLLAFDTTPSCTSGIVMKATIDINGDMDLLVDDVSVLTSGDNTLTGGSCAIGIEYVNSVAEAEIDDFLCEDTIGKVKRGSMGYR